MRFLLCVSVLLAPTAALACSLSGNSPWLADPAEVEADASAPGAVTLSISGIKRGVGPESGPFGCGQMISSCDDLGWAEVSFAAEDDRTPRDKLAVEVELVDGELPGGLVLPEGPVYLEMISWIDDATDGQEEIDFRIRARAVDLAGNRGAWSEPVRVTDPGSSGGCSASAGNASLLALALLALARARRRT